MSTALPLRAETTIAIASALEVMAKLRDHFVEHGAVSGSDARWSAEFGIGVVDAVVADDAVRFCVSAADETSLAFLQWGVTEHVGEFSAGPAPEVVWQGGTGAGAPLPYFREMRVLRAVQLTPRMRRLTLGGDDLLRFSHDGLHVRLLLAPEKGVKPVWPLMAADGRQVWPEGPRPSIASTRSAGSTWRPAKSTSTSCFMKAMKRRAQPSRRKPARAMWWA